MSTNNKKSVAAQALIDVDNIKQSLKEESKSTIASLLEEAVKDYMRDSIDGEDEDDMEIKDDEQESAEELDGNDESEAQSTEDDAVKPEEDDAEEGAGEEDAEVEGDVENNETPEEGDEWSEFEKFKVDDNTYDLTGAEDYDSVVKVYKLLKDDDNVVVKKDGDKITLKDEENDAEYVIDLGTDDECEGEECEGDTLQEGCMDEVEAEKAACIPENKCCKAKKIMAKENKKERIFEIDLGYTDNYQDVDPIEGLSVNEPGKGETLDKGIPTDAKKPWAGKDSKKAGAPYGEKQIDEDVTVPVEDMREDEMPAEPIMQEAMTIGGDSQLRGAGKSGIPSGRKDYIPSGSRHVSAGGDYTEVKLAESVLAKSEAILKENKELKKTLSKVKNALQEALMVNVNLGKVTKLFLENTTTQKEKIDIINRFNESKTIDQSNALYESIKRELGKGAKQNLTLEGKSLTANGSELISENKIYESQDLLDIKNFMKRMQDC